MKLAIHLIAFGIVLANCNAKLEISTREKEAIDKFRPLVKELMTHEYQTAPDYLLRWLKAKKLNLQEAVQLFRESQELRKLHNIDTILSETFPPEFASFQINSDGFDKEGRTVYTTSLGNIDLRKVVIAGQKDKWIRYTLQHTEKAVSRAAEKVYRSNGTFSDSRYVSLIDMLGFSLRKHACLSCLEMVNARTKISEKIYPGIEALSATINTPRAAVPLYRAVLSVVSPDTRGSNFIFGTNRTEYSEFLLKIIPADQLTYQFGGTRKG